MDETDLRFLDSAGKYGILKAKETLNTEKGVKEKFILSIEELKQIIELIEAQPLPLKSKQFAGLSKTALLSYDTQIPVRYFAYDFDDEEVELIEVDKQTFDSLEGKVTTERHTMFTNGCNQVCHTKENY